MMRRTSRPWPLLALAALFGACSFAIDAAPLVVNRCSAEEECAGASCDAARGMCVAPTGTATLRVALEIAVPSAAGTRAWVSDVAPFEVNGPRALDLASCEASASPCLPQPVGVTGTVRRADGRPVEADVSFVAGSAIPGRGGATLTVSAREGFVADADYVAELVGGAQYDVLVRPRGEDAETLPPLALPPVVAPARGTLVASFTYPAELDTFTGVLLDATLHALPGVTVQAVDPERGGVPVSTLAVTAGPDAPEGEGGFTLRLSPGVDRYVLRVGGAAVPGELPSPVYDVDPMYLVADAGGRAQVLVPERRVVRYRGSVNVEGDALAPVAGATVEFRAPELVDARTGAVGRFRASPVTTDADGRFEALLVPGTFDVVVRPPATEDAAALGVQATRVTLSDAVGELLEGQVFELPPRFTWGGTVAAPDGRHVPGASVLASARGAYTSGGADLAMLFNRSGATTSDDTGAFTLPLDRGLYDVAVKPPAGSGFPWAIVRDVAIGATSGNFVREVVLEAPVTLGGTLRGVGDVPIEGAELRAFAIVAEMGASPRAIEVARATTAADGSYLLLLPARVQ
jgi:hypothetical protein